MPEIWKTIPGHADYEVSDMGRVRKGGRILMTSKRNGYSRCHLQVGRKQMKFSVHCLVALAFIGPRPKGHDVCHADHDKDNNTLLNLRYDTRQNNVQDNIRDKRYSWAYPTEAYKRANLAVDELAASLNMSRRDIFMVIGQLKNKAPLAMKCVESGAHEIA